MMQQNLGKKQLVGEFKSYMEPTTEKDEYGEVIRSGNLHLWRNCTYLC